MTIQVPAFDLALWCCFGMVALGLMLVFTAKTGAFGMPDERGCAGLLLVFAGVVAVIALWVGRLAS